MSRPRTCRRRRQRRRGIYRGAIGRRYLAWWLGWGRGAASATRSRTATQSSPHDAVRPIVVAPPALRALLPGAANCDVQAGASVPLLVPVDRLVLA
eukprot:9491253-Pyramimonas_sp.AAC.2